MKTKLFVGLLMGFPPYGIMLKPFGETVQWIGVGIQLIGFVLCVWSAWSSRWRI